MIARTSIITRTSIIKWAYEKEPEAPLLFLEHLLLTMEHLPYMNRRRPQTEAQREHLMSVLRTIVRPQDEKD
jgi:hypothetical protein